MKSFAMFWLVLGLLLGLGASAWAEYYKYRDENGAIRFTDDIMQVPVDQRQKIERYKSFESTQPNPTPNVSSDKNTVQNSNPGGEGEEEGGPKSAGKVDEGPILARKAELEAEQAALKTDFADLQKEKKRLDEMAEELKKVNDRNKNAQHRDAVTKLNERIQKYNERRKKFEAERDAYYDLLRKASKM